MLLPLVLMLPDGNLFFRIKKGRARARSAANQASTAENRRINA